MNYEEKIQELTKRIEKLEKAEQKRIIKKRIEIITRISMFLIAIIVIFLLWNYVNNSYIKPYKESIDKVNEKIDTIDNYLDDPIGKIKNIFD